MLLDLLCLIGYFALPTIGITFAYQMMFDREANIMTETRLEKREDGYAVKEGYNFDVYERGELRLRSFIRNSIVMTIIGIVTFVIFNLFGASQTKNTFTTIVEISHIIGLIIATIGAVFHIVINVKRDGKSIAPIIFYIIYVIVNIGFLSWAASTKY